MRTTAGSLGRRASFAACAAWLLLAGALTGCDSSSRSDLGRGLNTEVPNGGGAAAGGAATAGGAAAGVAGASGGSASAGASSGGAMVDEGIAKKYADYFPVGVAIGTTQLAALPQIIATDFDHFTCENAMKQADIHPAPDTYAWDDADRIADYARQHGQKLTGHALLWHQQVPAWMFAGVTAGDAASLEVLKSRLKSHIEAVVDRYADVVDNWDVVNEAISNTDGKQYRDGSEDSQWYALFGSEEYIYWAYQYAKDALEAKAPGSSAGKLYYNDYTTTLKADKILKMLAWLKDDKGIQIDGVGFQSHENLTWPSTADLQVAFDKFKAAGYKVKISELDITVYSDYSTGAFVASPAVQLTPELEARQAKRFADLFALYRANKDLITSVTFWGISDDQSWLNDAPVPGRTDFPLLYNAAHMPKAARAAIMDF